MTRGPFDPRETGSAGGETDRVAAELERYANLAQGELPHGLADRVMNRVAEEPTPRRGILAWLLAPFLAGPGGAAQVVMVAGTVALAVLAVVLAGQLGDLLGNRQTGTSPSPTVQESPSITPTPTLSPSVTPSPSPSLTPTPSPSPSSAAPVVTPSPSDDDGPETPEPSDDDGPETPEPSDDDNSGPGGGGDSDSD